jgi:hypothetical protein
MKYNLPIVLIGPMAAGKSTVATEIAKLIDVPNVPMDRVRWYYYFSEGYSLERATSMAFSDRVVYWKPFEVSAVRRILSDFPNSIIDFGAGHSHFADEKQFSTVQDILAPVRNVFLLLPSADKEESIRVCRERLKSRGEDVDKFDDTNRSFIEHPSNYLLSKHIIYNSGEDPEITARKIIELLS